MCGIAEAFMVISAATTMASHDQQKQVAEQTAESAAVAATHQNAGLQARSEENRLRATAEMSERQRQHMRERAKIRAATAESGLSGNSPLRNLVTSDINASLDHDTIALNAALANNQTMRDVGTVEAQRTSRTDAAIGEVPSAFGQLLQIGQAGLGGYAGGHTIEQRMNRAKKQ